MAGETTEKTEMVYWKPAPKEPDPEIVVSIEAVYGVWQAKGGPNTIRVFRQQNESNETLANRAAQLLKQDLIDALNDETDRRIFERTQNRPSDKKLPVEKAEKLVDEF